MARPLDEIGAPVPLRGPRRIDPEVAGMEEQGVPQLQKEADVERERQLIGGLHLIARWKRREIGPERVDVGARHPAEIGVGKDRIEVLAAMTDALVH